MFSLSDFVSEATTPVGTLRGVVNWMNLIFLELEDSHFLRAEFKGDASSQVSHLLCLAKSSSHDHPCGDLWLNEEGVHGFVKAIEEVITALSEKTNATPSTQDIPSSKGCISRWVSGDGIRPYLDFPQEGIRAFLLDASKSHWFVAGIAAKDLTTAKVSKCVFMDNHEERAMYAVQFIREDGSKECIMASVSAGFPRFLNRILGIPENGPYVP